MKSADVPPGIRPPRREHLGNTLKLLEQRERSPLRMPVPTRLAGFTESPRHPGFSNRCHP